MIIEKNQNQITKISEPPKGGFLMRTTHLKKKLGAADVNKSSKELLEWYENDCLLSDEVWKSNLKRIFNTDIYSK
jgi:hypothetical protein